MYSTTSCILQRSVLRGHFSISEDQVWTNRKWDFQELQEVCNGENEQALKKGLYTIKIQL